MIISHIHKYVFVELPHTGTTAISRELCEHYGGAKILRKHAHYREFLKVASPKERRYFVLSGIRNPLDEAVSLYFKYKTDHKRRFSNPRGRKAITKRDMERFRFIKDTEADFPAYFERFYRWPYDNWSSLSHGDFDFVLRFENLQEDFAKALEMIGVAQKRLLPQVNRTSGKRRFVSYYTREITPRAAAVFGPFMKKWGYDFPPEWGQVSVPWRSRVIFRVLNVFRNIYWRHVRWSPHVHGKLFRRLLMHEETQKEVKAPPVVHAGDR